MRVYLAMPCVAMSTIAGDVVRKYLLAELSLLQQACIPTAGAETAHAIESIAAVNGLSTQCPFENMKPYV